jgi:hypothetical protein
MSENTEWTGEPMVESCDTTDFFEVDKVYVNGENPFRAPELTPEFWCKLVVTHPTLRTLWAVGWSRSGHFSAWDYGLSAYTPTQWREGKWAESPYVNETGLG